MFSDTFTNHATIAALANEIVASRPVRDVIVPDFGEYTGPTSLEKNVVDAATPLAFASSRVRMHTSELSVQCNNRAITTCTCNNHTNG